MIFYLIFVFVILVGAMTSCPTSNCFSVGIPLLIILTILPLIFNYNLKNKKNIDKE